MKAIEMTALIFAVMFFFPLDSFCQEEVTLQFTVEDEKHMKLNGQLVADININGETLRVEDIIVSGGYGFAVVEIDPSYGRNGTISVIFSPAEDPWSLDMDTPILYHLRYPSEIVYFSISEESSLAFSVKPQTKPIQIVSASKEGAVRTFTSSSKLTASAKAYMEFGADAIIASGKAGVELEIGGEYGQTLTDTHLSEHENRIMYTVDYWTGALLLAQNKDH